MTFDTFILDARAIMTVASFLSFLGIVWWACTPRRQADFDSAASLPFAGEDDLVQIPAQGASMEQNHG